MQQEDRHQQTNKQLVDNAMTMQKALETAYNDWNKQKSPEPTSQVSEEPEASEKVGALARQVAQMSTAENKITTSHPNSSTNTDIEMNKATTEIAYMFGNPHVDLVKGFIHIYKDWY